MRFSVCIKQVPDVSAPIQLRGAELAYDQGRVVLNAYDASALEAALVLAEKVGGEIDLVLVGPRRAQEALRKGLAMGADRATHLVTEAELDARGYAALLADYFRTAAYDVVLCGKQAQDTDAGLTGSMLAELLGLPFVSNAVALDVDAGGSRLTATRQGDVGQEVVTLAAPCLVTCSNDMNDPRIPSLKGIMAAKRKAIDERVVEAPSGLPAVEVLGYEPMPERTPGRRLEGEPEDLARTLARLLADEARVI